MNRYTKSDNETINQVGIRLKLLRDHTGLNQTETAIRISEMFEFKLSPGTLSKWEAGKETPSLDNVRRLAIYYDTTLDYLANGEEITATIQEQAKTIVGSLANKPSLYVIWRLLKDLREDDLDLLFAIIKRFSIKKG
ncbi:MAG: helix-turn-helix domain-containing protein [Youngiibacter sp.]|nr:helix-turn-helix domain-containing protein [Youngiibacter sp.]